jgi:hypothetical protein
VGPGAGLDICEKSRLTPIRSPDLPARSESLYRLRYPGSHQDFVLVYISHFIRYTEAHHLPPFKRNLGFEVIYYIIFSAFCYIVFSSCNQCARFIISRTKIIIYSQ